MSNYDFLDKDVPETLARLKPDSKPAWGEMSAEELMEHLRVSVLLSVNNPDRTVGTPDERLPLYKQFLMGDRPFAQGQPQPEAFSNVPPLEADFKERKAELLEAVKKMKNHFENHPDHTELHQYFGELNVDEWLQLHKKHFTHHFNQFGLL